MRSVLVAATEANGGRGSKHSGTQSLPPSSSRPCCLSSWHSCSGNSPGLGTEDLGSRPPPSPLAPCGQVTLWLFPPLPVATIIPSPGCAEEEQMGAKALVERVCEGPLTPQSVTVRMLGQHDLRSRARSRLGWHSFGQQPSAAPLERSSPLQRGSGGPGRG